MPTPPPPRDHPPFSLDRRTFLGRAGALAAGALVGGAGWSAGAAPSARPAPPAPMLSRPIPSTRTALPVVGLGTWQVFDPPERTPAALAELEATLRTFHDAGGRVVDSSPMYGGAEALVGELGQRAGLLPSLFLATKVWTTGEREGVRQMAQSETRLRRTPLDLMQIHNLVDWRTHLATLRRWREQGRVRHVGVTHYQPSAYPELERIVAREHVDTVQLQYSVAVRDAERRLLPAARDAGVAVLVNMPFGGGGLLRGLLGRPLPDAVTPWAASWPQALLKFVLAHPAVTCVLVGTGNPRHMTDNAAAGTGRLPDESERAALLRALDVA